MLSMYHYITVIPLLQHGSVPHKKIAELSGKCMTFIKIFLNFTDKLCYTILIYGIRQKVGDFF